MEKHILIVEDSPTCQHIAKESLKVLGFIQVAGTCEAAKNLVRFNSFDLILVDVVLPDGDGIELLSEIRNHPNCAQSRIVLATAEEDISKKVAAFSVGADDYLVKPYSPLELRARVDRLFRKVESDGVFSDAGTGIKLNSLSYRALLEEGNRVCDLDLTPQEFKILNLLIRHPERIYNRSQIIDKVWGAGVFISERTVDTHISSLRKKLKLHSECLASVRGEGYKWLQRRQQPVAA